MLPFVAIAGLILVGTCYLAWRVYDSPVDEVGAGLVATRASNVLVQAGGGDASYCTNMREVSAPDDAEDAIRRCGELADLGAVGGRGWLGTRDLRATKVDVGRHSGTVTVSGTLLVAGPDRPLTVTWPVVRVDGAWTVTSGGDIEVG